MAVATAKGTSALLLQELLDAEDPRFLPEVLACEDDRALAKLAPKWAAAARRDNRPEARRTLLAYIDDGCDRARHRVLVRRLLEEAEAHDDDVLMAHFLHAFDGLRRYDVVTRTRYDWYARRMVRYRSRRPSGPSKRPRWTREAMRLRKLAPKPRFRAPWFSGRTRRYLQRRALRWFRTIGRDPERFTAAIEAALPLYRDADLARPEHLLDTYGLTSLLFHSSPVLHRTAKAIRVRGGKKLAELEAAPLRPDAWRHAPERLVRLLLRCDCLLVRRFLVQWLEREAPGELRGMDARRLLPLLLTEHPDVRRFAIERLEDAEGLGALGVDDWLELLRLDDAEVLPLVCRLVQEHVAASRLDRAALVELAQTSAHSVAQLSFGWLKDRGIDDAEQLHEAMALADARCAPVREAGARWLIEAVRGPLGTAEHLRELIDARHAEVRALALATLTEEPRFADDESLWLAASESPYPDVRELLLSHLEARETELPDDALARLWAATLLGVHRGSRAKRRALRQIADRVVRDETQADELLPILRVALRSVREPERRAALAQVARAAFARPSLVEKLRAHVPELSFGAEGAA